MTEALHAEQLPQEETYRSISGGAICVLVGGLLSPLAFISPVLWFIPLAVILAAVWVLRGLAANADRFTGGRLAWIGLGIALLTLGWAPARHFMRQSGLQADARKTADAWAEMLNRRETQSAHQWHMSSLERADSNTTLAAFYAEQPERQKALQMFLDRPAVKRWLALNKPQATFQSVVKQNSLPDADEVVLKYQLRGESEGKSEEFPVWIVVVRRDPTPGKYEMYVANVIDYDPVPLDDN